VVNPAEWLAEAPGRQWLKSWRCSEHERRKRCMGDGRAQRAATARAEAAAAGVTGQHNGLL
jgi:hypothetical protein